jgi:signal transduction histidine kinase
MDLSVSAVIKDGNFSGMQVLGRDITERKKVEDDLRRSEERYRLLFDESPISLWEEDFSDIMDWSETKRALGIEDFRAYLELHPEDVVSCARMVHITRINRATMVLFGAHSGKEFSDGLSSVFTDESYYAFREELIALLSGKTGFDSEVTVRAITGEKKVALMKLIVVPGYEQTLEKVILSFIEISEQKRIQDALQQANKKIKMLSSITRHDIRNQLMVLRGYLDLSRMDVKDPELLRYIQKEDLAAESISNQIEFTKYYEEIGVNAPEWQELTQLIHSARSQLPALDNIEMIINIPPVKVFADALIEKVFYNLMDNTVRHGERVTCIRFSFHESDSGAEIVYEDNGVGIPHEDKSSLFQKGFGKNTGLGLFLSQEILVITGLTIRETGEPGKGVRFVIAVPKGAYRFSGNQ